VAHKTLTISEEAYEALAQLKRDGESFTRVILRITPRHTAGKLLEHVRRKGPATDLADAVERVYKDRANTRLREVDLE
jgi:predicted CopG family antitoxin